MKRMTAISWWNTLSFEERWYSIIANKDNIAGYPDRGPDSLTGREIQLIYEKQTK